MCTNKMPNLNVEILAKAVGRRKEAVAQVQLVKGTGRFIINDKPAQIYLQNHSCSILAIKAPFETLQNSGLVPAQLNGSFQENMKSNSEGLSNKENVAGLETNKESSISNPSNTVSSETGSLALKENIETIGNSISPDFLLSGIDTFVKVQGGGLLGQAQAVKLGVARALCQMEIQLEAPGPIRQALKVKGYLTSDSRCKERRKYGLKKARKASQYHKR